MSQANSPKALKTILASTALLGLIASLAIRHAEDDDGLSAQDITETDLETAAAMGVSSGALLVDFVEPEDGEGGSERAIRRAVEREIEDLGLDAELAGFYAETEHLYRVEGPQQALDALAERLREHPLVEGVEAEIYYSLPAHAMSAWDGPSPEEVEPAKPSKPRFIPNDPMYPLQWHLDAINSPEAWTITRGQGAVVAVIDTGVAYKDLKWKQLDAKAVPDLAGVEFVDGETFLDNALPDGLDDHAHGTHVAGTIAQATDNNLGVAGVAHESKIMPLKVLAGDGRGSVASIANAIRYAADHDADVINMSLGGPLPSRVMAKAVEYAHDKGTTVVCAAGNEKKSRVSYPAAYEGSVSVAATNWEGTRSFYSNWGKKLDISAPGGDTRSDKNGDGHPDGVLQNTIKIQDPSRNDYLWFQGTSMASPHAAGVAALIVSQGVNNPKEVERILKQTANHPNNKEWDQEYGAGIIDAEKAVKAARSDYRVERMGFLGVLGLLGLGGVGAGAVSGDRRRKLLVGGGGLAAGAMLGAGVVGVPLAYGASMLTGGLGIALFLSALFPALLVISLFHKQGLRGLLAGLSLGFAAVLAHAAVVMPTLLDAVPGGAGWDRMWLAANAAICLWLAHKVSKR